ncbi:hypothetical protein GCM10022378_03510 [Salinicoccus jeotgali]|uniref:Copper resistance protein D domain-containing protein n=1 Tax=Salinicoccus jeotgali TaxID=381634 RepID=A0ABP7EBJ3_9STAP
MNWTIYQTLLWIHIFLAINWVGGLLFVGWGVFPLLKIFPLQDARRTIKAIMKHSHYLFTMIGAGVILTGILLGTWLGPVKSFGMIWQTHYGIVWFSALIIGVLTLIWGTFIGYPYAMRVLSEGTIWEAASTGDYTPLIRSLAGLVFVESVEGAGFIVLLTLMLML